MPYDCYISCAFADLSRVVGLRRHLIAERYTMENAAKMGIASPETQSYPAMFVRTCVRASERK